MAVDSAGHAERAESVRLLLLGSDGARGLGRSASGDRESLDRRARRSHRRKIGHLLLVLLRGAGHHNQALLVSLETVSIELKAFLAPVLAAVVHRDADRKGLDLADTSGLELLNREATALTQLGVVLQGLATDGRAQRLQRAHAQSSSLGGTSIATALLTAGLVEPHTHPALPVLVEVVVMQQVVVAETHSESVSTRSMKSRARTTTCAASSVCLPC